MMLRILVPTFFIFASLYCHAQTDTLFRKGEHADTMILKKEPVIISRSYVLKQNHYKEVNNYFYLRPYISYFYFHNEYYDKKSSLLARAYCYSVKEKSGFNTGLDLAYKYKKYNLLVGYSFYLFREDVNDYKKNVTYENSYSVHQAALKILYEIVFKKITLCPYAGISHTMAVAPKTIYPVLNTEERVEFAAVRDFHRAGTLSFASGLELRFFNSKSISPFIGFGYMQSLSREGNESHYHVQLKKYVYSATTGLLVKF